MNDAHLCYIAAAYGVAAVVLIALILQSFWRWNRMRRHLED